MSRLQFIADDEGTRGHRKVFRDTLVAQGFKVADLNVMYPGSDIVWSTGHIPRKMVGVQLKTTTDFFMSWHSGHLQEQLHNLIRCVEIPILLIEGEATIDKKTGGVHTSQYGLVKDDNSKPIPYASYVHSLADCTGFAPGRFSLIMSPSMEFTTNWCLELGPKHFDADLYKSWERIQLPERNRDGALQALLGTRGMGEVRLRAVLARFQTPFAALIALQLRRWVEVDGVGEVLQEKARKQWGSAYLHVGKVKKEL